MKTNKKKTILIICKIVCDCSVTQQKKSTQTHSLSLYPQVSTLKELSKSIQKKTSSFNIFSFSEKVSTLSTKLDRTNLKNKK